MKKIIYLLMAFMACYACSEDNIKPELDFNVEPELSNATPLDKKIADFYKKYDTYIAYSYTSAEINWNWDSYYNYVYSFPENTDYAEKLLDFVQEKVLVKYSDEMLKEFLPYRIYLTDTLWETKNKKTQRYGLIGVNSYIWGGAGSKSFPAKTKLKAAMQELHECVASGLIAKTTVLPEEFYSVSTYEAEVITNDKLMWERGYIWRNSRLQPTKEQDFYKYVGWFAGTTKEEATALCDQYPLIKKKYAYLVQYFKDNFDIDLEAFHWKN
ncbi:putative zinc-binding metallopeptidase [Gabonibacter chumensis]|uniref:putative zinc-binding metallopeptidase n=1 Tax=Gabonibacter chumensis TaxID=2972474 RepID=UPI0025740FED|nr:putative zinc-binding metallopeptidase [Gabonibacter chumensis]MCR9012010.1 putative zinc-binding metallopeptidase [Gabonibacter chumensis]